MADQQQQTPQRRDPMMAKAFAIAGSSDVEAVLVQLRGLQAGHLEAAIRLSEQMADPSGRAEQEGHYDRARLLQQLRGERDSQLQAAEKYAQQIAEIERAGE